MGELLTHVLAGALQAVAAAWRGALGATGARICRDDPFTVGSASLAGALFVPSLVGSGFFFTAVLRFLDDDLFWFFGMIIGIPLAVFLATCALLGMAAGVTVGAWLLADRPLARLAAAVLSLLGIVIGWTLVEGQSPVASVIGQATLVLAVPLLLLSAVPHRAGSASPPGIDLTPGPVEGAKVRRAGRRFVL